MKKMFNLLVTGLGVIGSAFIKKTAAGKYEVALAPLMLAAAVGSGATCAVQDNEPFSVCFKDTLTTIKGLLYAN